MSKSNVDISSSLKLTEGCGICWSITTESKFTYLEVFEYTRSTKPWSLPALYQQKSKGKSQIVSQKLDFEKYEIKNGRESIVNLPEELFDVF